MAFFKNLSLSTNDLAEEIPYLDVDGALLLPSGDKALSLQEPKHLNLIDQVLQDPQRLVAIIPTHNKKFITDIGCAGKVKSFIETEDGKYLISISGVCRFHIDRIYTNKSGIKKVVPIWYEFLDDLEFTNQKISDRTSLNYIASDYFNVMKKNDKFSLSKITKIDDLEFINMLAENIDNTLDRKEKLIKAKNLDEFSEVFLNYMEMAVAEYESKEFLKH